MMVVLLGMLVACISCYLIVRFNKLHAHLSSDHVDAGPQKFHAQPTPRIGGIAIALGLVVAYLYVSISHQNEEVTILFSYLLLAAIPAFAGGLVEDLTKRVSVLKRLILSMVSAGIGAWLLGAIVSHLGVAPLDWLLQWPVIAVMFTLFAVGGVVNAINIIDGFNGIVSGFAGFMLLAIAFVSFQLDDLFLLNASLAMLGVLLGFLFWNYPHGKIFLGDGGSYLVGFWLAEMAVLIVARHPSVSPWFAALLLVHPVCETLFSVYRRKFLHKKSPWYHDALHLHTLIFRRLNHRQWASRSARHKAQCNSMTAPYFWAPEFLSALLAVLFWDNSIALIISTFSFGVFYIWLYWRIVKFRTPRWLVKCERRRYRLGAYESVCASGAEEKRDRRSVHRFGFVQFRFPSWLIRRDRRHAPVRTDIIFRVARSSSQSDRRSSRGDEKEAIEPSIK